MTTPNGDSQPSSERQPSLTLNKLHNKDLSLPIPVFLPHNLTSLEFHALLPSSPDTPPAFTFPALSNWLSRLLQNFSLQNHENHPFHKHGYALRELDVQAVDWFWRDVPGKEDKLGFMKIQAKIETEPYLHEGKEKKSADWLPGAVFLRGGSVGILIIVQPADAIGDDEKYVIFTVQPRIAAGCLAFTEIPAGMLDGSSFKGSAASEIEEEARLKVKESDLISLSELVASPWTYNFEQAPPVPEDPYTFEDDVASITGMEHVTQAEAFTSFVKLVQRTFLDQPDIFRQFLTTLQTAEREKAAFETTVQKLIVLFGPDKTELIAVFVIAFTDWPQYKPSKTEIAEETHPAMYPSAGACDEFIPLFLCQKRLTRRHMEWLKGKATGLRDEGENITLKLVPLKRAWREGARDAKALAALGLYGNLRAEGGIPDMLGEVEDEPEEFNK